MTEERVDTSTAGTDGTTGEPVVASGAQTAEEIEAFWRNRWSGTDRAHNAEVASLKEQIAALQNPPAQAPVGESPEAAQIRELREQLAAAQADRDREARARQYPQAASVLGDEVANLSPEKLAALEALYDNGGGAPAPMIDPNAAGRSNGSVTGPQAKPLNEKTKDELLADLKKAAPGIQAEAREGIYR